MEKKNLLESYKGRLAVSEKYFAQTNNGAKMDAAKKMVTAQCLDNVARYMNEAFNTSVGTQRSDLGDYKRFCLDITTLTMPNLIINDLFIVQPMSSFQGYLTYMDFGLGTAKGGVGGLDANGNMNTVTQDPFVWAPMTEARSRYTGRAVVEPLTDGQLKVAYTPVLDGAFFLDAAGNKLEGGEVAADGTITLPTAGTAVKVAYEYDNETIPQDKLPTMIGQMKGISLTARARRIAIQYSQFAAFQSKQDYGLDFESTIAQQAQAELQYEIDSEAVFMIKNAADAVADNKVTWVDEELDTISYSMKAKPILVLA